MNEMELETQKDAAKRTGLHHETLRCLEALGILPARRFGPAAVFRKVDVDDVASRIQIGKAVIKARKAEQEIN